MVASETVVTAVRPWLSLRLTPSATDPPCDAVWDWERVVDWEWVLACDQLSDSLSVPPWLCPALPP